MKIASIDIGTNTILLHIAECDTLNYTIRPLENRSQIPRIGKGVAESRMISDEKISLLAEILTGYKSICDKLGCEKIIAAGTYPFRTAVNSNSVIDEVFARTGIRIEILSGPEEAFLSFLGASYCEPPSVECAVIDIGGGSTEISLGADRKLTHRNSIPFGAVNTTEKQLQRQPVSQDKLIEFKEYLLTTIQQGFTFKKSFAKCLAVAGTPTTLAVMKAGLPDFDEEKTDRSMLIRNDIDYFTTELAGLTPDEIINKYGKITYGRADVLLAGTCILSAIMAHFRLDSVTVSVKGLRHGMLFHYLFRTFGRYFELAC